eukprot:TRINITY_DN5685_c3_g1_i1.p1 TRINITY_DN5685_c3_g1~~TRINITY_DN5685_c3_g1_i1.p1  ORF type:complete len:315 (-),score=60.47 TRINITY_DN5685_c3_g1_i1:107-1018(-)
MTTAAESSDTDRFLDPTNVDPELGLGDAFRGLGADAYLAPDHPLRLFGEDAVRRQAPPPLVLSLIGKCGNGKSSTANTLLGRQCFESRRSAASVTQECQLGMTQTPTESTSVDGIPSLPEGTPLVIVDTPGLGDPRIDIQVLCSQMRTTMDSVEKCLKTVGTEPKFAILLVLGVHGRISDDDMQAARALHAVFGWKFLSTTVVVWTHGDLLDAGGLEGHLEGASQDIKDFLNSTKGSVVLDNRLQNSEEMKMAQLAKLLGAANAAAGPASRPRGKHVRKLRQASLRAEWRSQEAAKPSFCTLL